MSLIDRARSAFWAWTVKNQSGLDFAALERELLPESVRPRAGGGYEQPYAWYKYAKGERAPLPPEKGENSPVLIADKRYPGTAQAYQSFTWDLLYPADEVLPKPLALTNRISPYVLSRLDEEDIEGIDQERILLTLEGAGRAVLIKHFDAFGLLLMQWRNGTPERLSVELVYLTRIWLLHAFEWMSPFPECRHLLLELFQENLCELGVLEGPGGLDLDKNMQERMNDAFWAAFLSGAVEIKGA